jgi:hypothetical protein
MNSEYNYIVEDKIFIGDSVNDLQTEIAENMWLVSMSTE